MDKFKVNNTLQNIIDNSMPLTVKINQLRKFIIDRK